MLHMPKHGEMNTLFWQVVKIINIKNSSEKIILTEWTMFLVPFPPRTSLKVCNNGQTFKHATAVSVLCTTRKNLHADQTIFI